MIATLQQLVGALAMTAVCSFVALPIMKYYARSISVYKLLLISVWAFMRAMLIVIVMYDVYILVLHKNSSSVPSLFDFVIFCGAGWLISRDIKQLGIEKPFPGIGARVIFGIITFSWIIVGIFYLTGTFSRL